MVEHILLMVECIFVLCTTFALVIKTNTIMNEIKEYELAHAIPIKPTKSFISFLKVKAFSM